MLRIHQAHLDSICSSMACGSMDLRKLIIAKATPGGGKSALPPIMAKYLIKPGIADKICWIVPRKSLQEQAEQSFIDPYLRSIIGHNAEIRAATNEHNPSRDYSGYVTTYSALAQDTASTNFNEFRKRDYILVLDEPHHIAVGSALENAIKPLVNSAAITLAMSGTLERDDKKRIAFMPYRDHLDGQVIDLSSNKNVQIVGYSRSDALRDKAIIRLLLSHVDARAEWKDKSGKSKVIESLSQERTDQSKALWTAINTEYAKTLLSRCVLDWKTHRRANQRSKLLVVAATQKLAREYSGFLTTIGVRSGVATMDEGAKAQKTIREFKRVGPDTLNCLVTVMMAYEGLDVKSITHICALTHIRSKPWIEQMLARATRFDPDAGPWERQFAHVFVPDDTEMREIVHRICTPEELLLVRKGGGKGMAGLPMEPGEMNGITPIGSGATGDRESELLSPMEREVLDKTLNDSGVTNITPRQLKAMILQAGYVRPGETAQTASVAEEYLRESIEKAVRRYAREKRKNIKALNARILRKFGKRRSDMSIAELQRVSEYVKINFCAETLF